MKTSIRTVTFVALLFAAWGNLLLADDKLKDQPALANRILEERDHRGPYAPYAAMLPPRTISFAVNRGLDSLQIPVNVRMDSLCSSFFPKGVGGFGVDFEEDTKINYYPKERRNPYIELRFRLGVSGNRDGELFPYCGQLFRWKINADDRLKDGGDAALERVEGELSKLSLPSRETLRILSLPAERVRKPGEPRFNACLGLHSPHTGGSTAFVLATTREIKASKRKDGNTTYQIKLEITQLQHNRFPQVRHIEGEFDYAEGDKIDNDIRELKIYRIVPPSPRDDLPGWVDFHVGEPILEKLPTKGPTPANRNSPRPQPTPEGRLASEKKENP